MSSAPGLYRGRPATRLDHGLHAAPAREPDPGCGPAPPICTTRERKTRLSLAHAIVSACSLQMICRESYSQASRVSLARLIEIRNFRSSGYVYRLRHLQDDRT